MIKISSFILFGFISLLSLAQNSTFKFAKQMGGNGWDESRSIAIDKQKNIFTTGVFQVTADFDPGSGTANLTSTSTSFYNIFVSKLDSNGNYIWAKKIGGTGDDEGNGITTDVSGNVYITGFF